MIKLGKKNTARGNTRDSSYSVYNITEKEPTLVKTTRQDCCMDLRKFNKGHEVYVYVFTHQLEYEGMGTYEYMKAVEEYICSLGVKVELMNKTPKRLLMDDPIKDGAKGAFIFKVFADEYSKGMVTLGAHSFIRMLWSKLFDGLWNSVFELRALDELSDLDNWEIWQLAEYKKSYFGYHGPLADYNNDRKVNKIISINGLNNRMHDKQFSRVWDSFGVQYEGSNDSFKEELINKSRKLFKDKKYRELYNLHSVKGQFTYGKCIDAKAKETQLMVGKTYKFEETKNKKFILVNCDDSIRRRLKTTRFEMLE